MDKDIQNEFEKIRYDLNRSAGAVDIEHQVLSFPATANQDLIIQTRLKPLDPENIYYEIVRFDFLSAPASTPVIYKDTSTTRRPWIAGQISLRCNVASVKCVIRLYIPR